jgi:hypothetical protein
MRRSKKEVKKRQYNNHINKQTINYKKKKKPPPTRSYLADADPVNRPALLPTRIPREVQMHVMAWVDNAVAAV